MRVDINLKKEIDTSYNIEIDTLKSIELDTKVAIVTNPKVAGLHLQYLLAHLKVKELYIITVADGEEYKNFKSVEFILDRLFDHRFNRKSMLIAFGGGVIGDMVGFSASIYQRGIDFIQIPTTLLSQVDASVGGKTGMNNSYGKNLVGAFHQPRAVYIDPSFLTTLPKREFGAGFAEILKMAVTFNKDFFTYLQAHTLDTKENVENLKVAIQKAVETKAWVVSQDEKEKGLRAALNYGHTFAHVIENETNYTGFLHGEAVAIGMVMANKVSVALGLMSQEEAQSVKALLEQYDLPTNYLIKDVDAFYDAFFLDKKSEDEDITFILAKGIGDVIISNSIDKAVIMQVLDTYKI